MLHHRGASLFASCITRQLHSGDRSHMLGQLLWLKCSPVTSLLVIHEPLQRISIYVCTETLIAIVHVVESLNMQYSSLIVVASYPGSFPSVGEEPGYGASLIVLPEVIPLGMKRCTQGLMTIHEQM